MGRISRSGIQDSKAKINVSSLTKATARERDTTSMMMMVEEVKVKVDDDNEEKTMKRRNAGGRIRIIPGMPMIHSCTCLHRKYLITRSVPVSLSFLAPARGSLFILLRCGNWLQLSNLHHFTYPWKSYTIIHSVPWNLN